MSNTNLEDVLPVKRIRKAIVDKEYIGKVDMYDIIECANGKELFREKVPNSWVAYAEEALNNYHKRTLTQPRQSAQTAQPPTLIARFRIPGRAIPYEDRKVIQKTVNNEYIIASNKEYSDWIGSIQQQRSKIIYDKNLYLPIKIPVIIAIEFFMCKTKKKDTLSELINSIMYVLQKLGIVKNISYDIVKSFYKTKITYVDSSKLEHTIVSIYKYIGG